MRGGVIDPDVVVKCIGPKGGREGGAIKHGTDGIANCTMGLLNRAILVRVTRGSEFNRITGSFKEIEDVMTFAQITTRIKANILVFDFAGGVILGEPCVEELKGRSFADEAITMEHTSIVVGDETVAGLTIFSGKTRDTGRIGTALNNETEVNREALIR